MVRNVVSSISGPKVSFFEHFGKSFSRLCSKINFPGSRRDNIFAACQPSELSCWGQGSRVEHSEGALLALARCVLRYFGDGVSPIEFFAHGVGAALLADCLESDDWNLISSSWEPGLRAVHWPIACQATAAIRWPLLRLADAILLRGSIFPSVTSRPWVIPRWIGVIRPNRILD